MFVATEPTIDIQGIKKIISQYEYNQFNILDKGIDITFNPMSKEVKFDNFYDYSSDSKSGSCTELMMKSCSELEWEYPQYYFTRVIGKDATFFTGIKANHSYLIATNKGVLGERNVSESQEDISNLLENGPIGIDPSFGVVDEFRKMKYSVRKIYNQDAILRVSNSKILQDSMSVPIGITTNGNLLSMGVNFDEKELIEFSIVRPNGSTQYLPYDSKKLLNALKNDKKMQDVVEMIRYTKKVMTTDNLKCNFRPFY